MTDATRESIRAEAAECLFALATRFIPPTRIIQPATLDAVGRLDAALATYKATGDVAGVDESWRTCWALGDLA